MGPDLKDEGRLDKEASGNKENACFMKELENEHVRCANNNEDTFEMEALMDEQTVGTDRSEDVEVNVLECTNSGEIGLVEPEYQEATENSSSFDEAVSVVENGAMLSDAEVGSELHGDTSLALPFGGVGEFFRMRRKKVTPHWRSFIQPLLWRCKWVELQIRKYQSQAMKCDRMLEKYNQRKQFELEKCTLEGCGARSFPFPGQNRRKEVMKRKRRKKVEDTVDIASYMSHHNLFSYYENKRSAAASMDDDWGNQVVTAEKTFNGNDEFGNDELLSLESKDGDNSLEHIFWKIGIVQSRVSNMKIRMNKVMSENASMFSSTDQLSLLEACNAWTSSARNPVFPHNNGDRMPVGSSHTATHLMGDLVMPETAASSHGKVTHFNEKVEIRDLPDIAGSSKHVNLSS